MKTRFLFITIEFLIIAISSKSQVMGTFTYGKSPDVL